MSSPSWCPACEESCLDQPDGICITCGEGLQQPPSANNYGSAQSSTAPAQRGHDPIEMAMLASSIQDTGIDAATIMPIVNQLRSTNGTQDTGISDIASLLPADALNPQAGSTRHMPVSKRVLDDLKRVVLTDQSAELFEAQVSVFDARGINDISPTGAPDKCMKLNAVPGEFGPRSSDATTRNTAALVVFSPRTTKGGLSSSTLEEITILRQHRMPFVAYVDRGDGITFVQKAIACQEAGKDSDKPNEKSLCVGVIVGNAGTAKEVWPYAMQDTKNEAETFGLTVPVVMVRRDDGQKLVQWAAKKQSGSDALQYTPCQMQVNPKEEHSCPVCAEVYVAGATTVRLPTCGHVFHEKCAMMWLTKHNTCPYCRKELPTENEEYEAERRRREARSGVDESEVGGSSFYG